MLPLARLSFYLLDSPAIRERETAVARLSGELAGRLPPATRAALAQCLEGINSYYSNLIEGQSTRPIEAERALKKTLAQRPKGRAGELALLAVAHIKTERWMRERLKNGPDLDIAGADFIRELHRQFVSQLPDELRVVKGHHGESAINVPGELRQRQVDVGAHVPPHPDELPALLAAFSKGWKALPKTPAHILLAHHRFAWIHPFLDGNGRIARLLTTAMLACHGLDADGLWSLSRGLAKRRDRYYEQLAQADNPREGDFDGRGALSQKAAVSFADFMLDTSEDQIRFMTERLQIGHVQDRMARFCAERKLVLGRDERAAPLLIEAMFMGRLERGAAPRLLGLGERAARKVVAECVEDGLLTATSSRADLMPVFPVYAAAYLFPNLFEIDDPQAAMRETLVTRQKV
ncbi:MAG: Fic family protein [Gammaproteobacteria bacterium]